MPARSTTSEYQPSPPITRLKGAGKGAGTPVSKVRIATSTRSGNCGGNKIMQRSPSIGG